jgi:choline-glycine betaine transporter
MVKATPSSHVLGAVFIFSVLICGAIGVWSVLAPDAVAGNALRGFALTMLDWVVLMLCTSFVVLGAVLALGPCGKIQLSADDDEPEFSTLSWIAMLFAGGMGAGLLFWGPAEPMYHFTGPPPDTAQLRGELGPITATMRGQWSYRSLLLSITSCLLLTLATQLTRTCPNPRTSLALHRE